MTYQVPSTFIPNNYRQCSVSLMDNIADPDIVFDTKGISNYYHYFKDFTSQDSFKQEQKSQNLTEVIAEIKQASRNKKYDCLLGLSGGADSSYLALMAKRHGLRPLIVHFDYGWNTDVAIRNIENTCNKLGFELFTYVIDWQIIRDLQRSYYMASVVDLDVPADHTIFGAIFELAKKMKIKYILSGSNYQTELIMPKTWNYLKSDKTNIKNIHKKFGQLPFKGIPTNGVIDQILYRFRGIQTVPLLYYIDFDQNAVYEEIKAELNWENYGGKHFENVYTRFYQGYVLPVKFGIDKRKPHLSNLIFSGQMTKGQALEIIQKPPYDPKQQAEDREYVAKKLGFTANEFDKLLHLPNTKHENYGTDRKLRERIFSIVKPFANNDQKETIRAKLNLS